MFTKGNITTVFFLLFAICSIGQTPSRIIFSRIIKEDGLASNSVSQVVRDKQGFLWIATLNGLQRHDGSRFITFRHLPGNPTTLPSNAINRIIIDSKERLWLMLDKHVGVFNTKDFTFRIAVLDSNIFMLRKITEDSQGRVILFADSKQFVYDEAKNSFLTGYEWPAFPTGHVITDMTVDHTSGNYWLTGKQGSLFYDPKTKRLNPGGMDSLVSIKNARYPFVASDGSYWVVSWLPFVGPAPVLYRFDKSKNKLQRFERIREYKTSASYYEIWNVFQQSNGTIWISGMGLLAYYNPAQNRFVNIKSDPFQKNGIDYDYVSGLYEDKEKNVWACTNKGIYRFNVDAQVFQSIPHQRLNDTAMYDRAVSAIVQTKNQGIWVSTWGAGIFSYNDQLQPIPNPLIALDPANRLLHGSYLIQRRNGEIWIGLQSGELKIYEPSTNKITTVSQPLLTGKTISQLFEDHAGNVWIGSTSGLLVRCEKGNWKDTANAYKSLLTEAADIMRIFEDRNHHIWVCTASDGLYEMDIEGRVVEKFIANADSHTGLLANGASDIVQYNDSTLLIASEGLCIFNIRTRRFKYLMPSDGLPAEHITNLILDKQKRLWVALDGGLYRLNIDSKLYVSYDAPDGITNNIFQVSTAALLQDGKIAIGTPYDFMVFDPEKTIDKKEAPPVTISGIMLDTKYLSLDSLQKLGKITLAYDNTFLSIKLGTLNFRDQYYMYYMLEGLDKTWKQVSNNEITYQYLPPGDYTLKLKTANAEGVESTAITTFRIDINPPFWETWWFYSLLALLMGGLLYWIDHVRIKRKMAILRMRSSIADGLHQDINGTLSNIAILSEIARMKADKEPEKAKEFIEQIRTKSETMSLAMEDILWSINPDNDSMKSFMLRYREYIDSLKAQNNVQIDVLVDKKTEHLQLKMKTRSDVFSLFKSGIRNVVKTGAKVSRIHITYEKPNLVYTLEFDTANVDMTLLTNLRQRKELTDKLEQLQARLDFSEHKANAVFVLTIPVKSDGI